MLLLLDSLLQETNCQRAMAGWLWNHWFWITAAGFPVSLCLDLPPHQHHRESNALRHPPTNQNPPIKHGQQHIGLGSLERWRLRKEERTSSFLERLLSKIKRFARVTLAGRAKPEEDDEEGEEIIIFVEEEDSKASGVKVSLKEKGEKVKVDLLEEKKELESSSRSPPTVSSSPAWESRKLIGRGGWRQIGPSRTSWRGHLEENEESEEGGRSRSSEARGRSLELDTISLQTQHTGEDEVAQFGGTWEISGAGHHLS